MDITVYLPDDLGRRAKEADLPFSQLLRAAVQRKLSQREASSKRDDGMSPQELHVENSQGAFKARFVGEELAHSSGRGGRGREGAIWLHEDGRVFWHDNKSMELQEIENPVEDLRELADREAYREAMRKLDLTPVVEL